MSTNKREKNADGNENKTKEIKHRYENSLQLYFLQHHFILGP